MKIDGFDRDTVRVILMTEDVRLLADLCNGLDEDIREHSFAHRETMGAALETVEMAMQWIPEPKAVTA